MFGSIQAISYRNFWLSYRANIYSLAFMSWGIATMFVWELRYSSMYPFIIYLLHIQQISINTYAMADDRCSGFKTSYHIMGLKKNQYMVGQLLSFIIQGTSINMLMYILGMLFNFLGGYQVLDAIESMFFVLAFLFLVQLSAFCMFVSFFFRNSLLAKDITFGINFLLIYFSLFWLFNGGSFIVKLLSPYYVFTESTINVYSNSKIDILEVALSMLGQAAFYFIVAVYLENVYSGSGDFKKSPLYFIDWIWKKPQPIVNIDFNEPMLKENIEHDTELLKNGLVILNMSKKFGKFNALKDVNIRFDKGKMHCLLGHNGAGKTTLINILTGSLAATKGDVLYNGEDFKELCKYQNSGLKIGLCPSNDILFSALTVYQHLKMAYLLHDVEEIDAKIVNIMAQIKLSEYADYKIEELSGGNKRRLTIALALVGEPNLLFLDEPTSSLDPASRKDIWGILSAIKATRPNVITILTTHHLEEAETLADDIVVLHQGMVKVSGSIEHIKKAFGVGYIIEVISSEPVHSYIFEDLLNNVNSSIDQNLLLTASKIQDTKMQIEIKISQTKFMADFLRVMRQLMPENMYLTVNSNTLEKAYIEIDRNLNKNANFDSELDIQDVLKGLYSNRKLSSLDVIWLIVKNKWLLLRSSTIEFFKVLAHYVILVSTAGLGAYFRHSEENTIKLDDLGMFIAFMIFLEIMMSSFSVYNLVYEDSKGLKFLMFANKVNPTTYYLGKLLGDYSIVTIGYVFIFTVVKLLIAEELKKDPQLIDGLREMMQMIFVWRLTYSSVGLVYHRLFKTTRSVLLFYNAFYFFVFIVYWLIANLLFPDIYFVNDFYLIIKTLHGDVSTTVAYPVFALLAVVHFCIAVYLESRSLRSNFWNAPQPAADFRWNNENVIVQNPNDIHDQLRETVVKEVKQTLSFESKKLKVIDLKKQYRNNKVALNAVTFSLDEGDQLGLVGPNGAGKSTLFNILLGRVNKTSGAIRANYMKEYISSVDYLFEDSPYISAQYGVCYQNDSVWDEILVKHNINFFAELHQINPSSLDRLFEYFEFSGHLEKHVGELSSGNKRKLSIIISLLINPNFLLYDEATSGVDLDTRLKLRGIFEYFAKNNKSMAIFTTHFLKDIDIFCNKIGVIDNGIFLCFDYLDNIKKNLGGYCMHMQLSDSEFKSRVVQSLTNHAGVKITHENKTTNSIKCLLNKIGNIADLFAELLAMEADGTLASFSLNQLSIEDIYLDIFNRSE
jgi:ATP-binding cassette subfamily A (ABC1) protein 3